MTLRNKNLTPLTRLTTRTALSQPSLNWKRVEEATEIVNLHRKQSWTEWCEHNWINSQGKIFRWVRQTAPGKFQSQELHKLHTNSWDPSTSLEERLTNTEEFWDGLWNNGDKHDIIHTICKLPRIMGRDVKFAVDHMNPQKAIGCDL